jgi:phosphoglycerate kinase
VSKLPYLFEKNERAIGFLIEKELAALNKLLEAPKKPFLMIIGGGKVKDKIPLIQNLFPLVDQIALCPAIVYTFLKAFNYQVGDSLVDEHFTTKVCDLAQQAQELHVQLWLPPDFLVEENGQLSIVPIGDFAPTARGVSFGPKTVEAWTDSINKAGTIFLNGLPGRLSKPETLTYYNELVKIVADSPAYTVIGGGDSVGAALKLNLQDKINYLSTGGGATLIYLSGEPLPGLQPFE